MIRFAKYHGCGNNFIIADEADVAGQDYSRLAVSVCSMATGIGADGFIVVRERACAGNGLLQYGRQPGAHVRQWHPVLRGLLLR